MSSSGRRKDKKFCLLKEEAGKFKDSNIHQSEVKLDNKFTNDDCLIQIFKQLPFKDRIMIERVCKKWNYLSKFSWSDFKKLNLSCLQKNSKLFEKPQTNLDKNQIFHKFISKCGKYINDVNINDVSWSSEDFNLSLILYYITLNCNNIVNLSVVGEKLKEPDVNFGFLFYKNKNLKFVEISFAKINGNCLLNLPCDTLEKLILRNVDISPVIPDFKIIFKNLKTFKIIQYRTLWFREFDLLFDKLSIGFGTNLTEFAFVSPNFNSYSEKLIHLLSEMKNLKTLLLGDCEINNLLLESLSVDTIETLIFDDCTISSICLIYCLINFKNLHTFGLRDVVLDEDLINAIPYSPNLKFLDLRLCKLSNYIPKITIHKLFKILDRLEILDLTSCEIDDHILAIISLHCKLLKALNLSNNEDITDSGLAFLTNIPKIEKFFIHDNDNVTDSELNCLPNIKELKLSQCKSIKSEGLCNVLKTCPLIETLDITKCNYCIIEDVIETAIETKNIRGKKMLNIYISDQDISEMYLKKNLSSSFIKIIYDKDGEKLTFSDYEIN